jgi:multidrug efflux pump subunit AcrA (membrane-fusion protein)
MKNALKSFGFYGGYHMDEKIFRKVSIDRLSSPEQLDRMITVTSTRSWLLLLAIGCILTTVIIWGITGSMETNVTARGMLIKSGGTIDIYASSTGQITDIRVVPGDYIDKGDIVARISRVELVEQISGLLDEIKLIKSNNSENETVMALDEQVKELRKKLMASSVVISREQGRVVEVIARPGDPVEPGSVVIRTVKDGEDVKNLIAVLYVPVEDGKELAPGMETKITPSTIQKEEYGYLLGRIVSVSEYPITVHTATQKLGSSELANNYVGNTACLEVMVDLVSNKRTESGYQWSTPFGPPRTIENGTICDASVVIDTQHPIEMVIPQIKNLLGD